VAKPYLSGRDFREKANAAVYRRDFAPWLLGDSWRLGYRTVRPGLRHMVVFRHGPDLPAGVVNAFLSAAGVAGYVVMAMHDGTIDLEPPSEHRHLLTSLPAIEAALLRSAIKDDAAAACEMTFGREERIPLPGGGYMTPEDITAVELGLAEQERGPIVLPEGDDGRAF
jgi:hypothetical protein